MTTATEEPKLRDYEDRAVLLRDPNGQAMKITSRDGKRVLWEAPDNQVEPSVTHTAEELSGVENTEKDSTVASASSVSVTHNPSSFKKVTPEQAQAMRKARLSGTTIPDISRQFGFGKTAVKRALGEVKPLNNPVTQAVPIITPDFSGVENTELPYSVRNAIRISLDTASHQAILGEGSVKAFFEGHIAGFNIALGIICGAAGIDISFLEEGHDDSTSNPQQ